MSHLTRTLRCLVSACIVLLPATAAAQQCSTQPDLDTGTQNLNFDSWVLNQPLVPSTAPLQPCEKISWTLTVTSQVSWGSNGQFKVYNASHDLLFAVNWSAGTTATTYTIPEATDLVGSPYNNTRGVEGQPSYYDMGTYWPVTYRVTSTRTPRPGYNTGGTGFANAPLISLPSTLYGSIHQREPGQYYKIHLDPGSVVYAHGQATAGTMPGSSLKIELYDLSQQSVAVLNYESIVGTTNFPTGSGSSATYTNSTGSGKDLYVRLYFNPYMIRDFAVTFESPKLTLFLDVDGNFNSASPESDVDSFVPGADWMDDSNVTPPRIKGVSLPLPTASTAIQRVQVIAAYTDSTGLIVTPAGTGNVVFTLNNSSGQNTSSAFDGVAMNWPDPRGPNQRDLVLVSSSAAFDVDNTARVNLDVWDYAGFATVFASQGSAQAEPMHLPKDSHNNFVPDVGWKATANHEIIGTIVNSGQDAGSDDELAPPGDGITPGDGLTFFEEYRGVVVRGEHRRLDAAIKDLFIDSVLDTSSVNVGYANNLPVTKHLIWPSEHNVDAFVNPFYVNAGFGGSAGHTAQRAILVREAAYAVYGLNGLSACLCSPNTSAVPSKIYVSAIREQTPPTYDLTTPDPSAADPYTDTGAVSVTVGHEVGHRIVIDHYYWSGAGGRLTPMVNGFDLWPQYYGWSYFPPYYDDVDLVQFRIR
jgi:hypothetical protein